MPERSKVVEDEVHSNSNHSWITWHISREPEKETGRTGNERKNCDSPDYWDLLEYWEESWRLEETCCHLDFNKKPSVKIDVKNLHKVITVIIGTNQNLS